MSTENPQEKDIFGAEPKGDGALHNPLEQGSFGRGSENKDFAQESQEQTHTPFEDDQHIGKTAENIQQSGAETSVVETAGMPDSNNIPEDSQAKVTEENLEHAVVNLEVNPDNAAEIVDDLTKITELNKVLSGDIQE